MPPIMAAPATIWSQSDASSGHQRHILAVAEHEPVVGVAVMGLGDRAVFAEIVDADDMVPMPEQLGDDITCNEAGGSGDQDFHVLSALGKPG